MKLLKTLAHVVTLTAAVAALYTVLRAPLLAVAPQPETQGADTGTPAGLPTPFGRVELDTQLQNDGLFVRAACVECVVDEAKIAPAPLRSRNAGVEGVLSGSRFSGQLFFEDLRLTLQTSWQNGAAAGTVALAETEMQRVFQALKHLVPEAGKAAITGTVSGSGSFEWPGFSLIFQPKIKGFTVQGLIPDAAYAYGPVRFRGKNRQGDPIIIESGEGSPNWLSLDLIGGLLPKAVIAMEDGSFYSHPGYDLANMVEAMQENKSKGTLRGASTLTQQLAKNLFLDNQRSYARKLRELLYAVELDREIGKKRVLELYLNIAEWGPEIYGAKKAASVYFKKTPAELTLVEAAWLASVLRAPKRAWERQFLPNKPRRKLADVVLYRMRSRNTLAPEVIEEALAAPIIFAR